MSRRIATLLLGVGLIIIGALFFIAPEQAFALRWLMRLWPVGLILAGMVRVAGYLIDRRPCSPVGGTMFIATGGILLSANLLGHHSLTLVLSRYWFWFLLAYVLGRLLRQYTYRIEDGFRPKAFSVGAIMFMVLIVGAGLAASYSIRRHNGRGIDLRLNNLNVGDYVFGNKIPVEDEVPQSFALAPDSRLIINNVNNAKGDIEINSAPQPVATAKLIRHIRAADVDTAKSIGKNIILQIVPISVGYQVNIAGADVDTDFDASIVITLPQNLKANIEISNALGGVKLSGLQGLQVIHGCERVEISRNAGGVTIANARGAVELSDIQGAVELTNLRRAANLKSIKGPIILEVKGGSVNLERSSGPFQLTASDAQIAIANLGDESSTKAPSVDIQEAHNSRIKLQSINGAVSIIADHTHIEAGKINGDFKVESSGDRLNATQINGALSINSAGGVVAVKDINGPATIEARSDVSVRNFRGPLKISSRDGKIDIETPEQLYNEVSAVSDHGKILVSIPKDVGFRLDAKVDFGKVNIRGFDDADWESQDRSHLSGYNISSSAPLISLHSSKDIFLQSTGTVMASHN